MWLIQNYNRFFRAIAIQALLPSPGKTEYYLNDHQSFEGIALCVLLLSLKKYLLITSKRFFLSGSDTFRHRGSDRDLESDRGLQDPT